jgi:glucose-6-phosphate isomerase
MAQSTQELWQRFQKYYRTYPTLGLAVDISRVQFPDDLFSTLGPRMQTAFSAMSALETGAIANPDEKRMVGHYWLRNPETAPNPEIAREIRETVSAVQTFAAAVHSGQIRAKSGPFQNVLLVGIGGSALGPQFVSAALGSPANDRMKMFFFDNTDPDGMDKVLDTIGQGLASTLCVVVSKSGGTKETRNGMLEAQAAFERAGLDFPRHAVAVTSKGSELDNLAVSQGWLRRFPMWDWVGGRTSELSAVGLLPAALQGIDIKALLAGAKACDEVTRVADLASNPAATLAVMWFHIGNGKGDKNMIVLPYKDRLELFSKYLQQLIMESLGKKLSLDGIEVFQGISVFGNKGSTDQHAYVQQLRDGRNDFFVTFIEVLRDRGGGSMEVEPGVTSGDYLSGFYQGTRTALYDSNRPSVTLTLTEISPFSVGVLIALFERTVGLYATLININPYHQPGVEAGKKAASKIIALQLLVGKLLASRRGEWLTADEIAVALGQPEDAEAIFKICQHLAANPDRKVRSEPNPSPALVRYSSVS